MSRNDKGTDHSQHTLFFNAKPFSTWWCRFFTVLSIKVSDCKDIRICWEYLLPAKKFKKKRKMQRKKFFQSKIKSVTFFNSN